MKKFLSASCLAILLGIGISSTGFAATINSGTFNGTDVGGVDIFKDSTNTLANSNPTTEQTWLNDALGTSGITYVTKEETVTYFTTDVANVYALQLTGTPSYYIIKNASYWALFQNVNSLSWAVFNSTVLPAGMNIPSDEFTISHVSEFTGGNGGGGGGGNAPEPGTIALLGIGLLGFGMTRLNKKA